MTDYALKALRAAAQAACDAAKHDPVLRNEPVNWADLGCECAQRCEDDSGHVSYRVVLREADPSACGLHKFVADRLGAAGFASIEIDTEW